MLQQFTNNASTTLAANIGSGSLTLTVATGTGALFPTLTGSQFFLATLYQVVSGIESNIEIIQVTARSTDVFTIVRAQEGTTATAYNTGDHVSLRMTAGLVNNLVDTSSAQTMSSKTLTTPAINQPIIAFGLTNTVSAAGTTQGTATAVTTDFINVTTCAAGAGVVLPTTVAGREITVKNNGANPLLVYPPSGGVIDSNATNAAYSVPVGATEAFAFTSTINSQTMEGRQSNLNVAYSVVQRDANGAFSAGILSLLASRTTYSSLGSSAINMALGECFSYTATASTTWTVSNAPASGAFGCFVLELTNGGAYTQTFMSGTKWAGGSAPTLTASGVDVLGFYTINGGTTWRGMVLAKASA